MKRQILAAVILLACIIATTVQPKAKTNSLNILSRINIPASAGDWQGLDIGSRFDQRELRYNSIGKFLARIYTNADDEHVMLLMFDSANFHNPKTCFGASGYDIKELADVDFNSPSQFSAKALYLNNSKEGRLVIYWMCIDKKLVGWLGQKIKELGFGLLNKQRTGVMVRLDILTTDDGIQDSILLAKDFIGSVGPHIGPRDAEYIFGK